MASVLWVFTASTFITWKRIVWIQISAYKHANIHTHTDIYKSTAHIHTHCWQKELGRCKKIPFHWFFFFFPNCVLPLKRPCNIPWCAWTNCSWQNLILFFFSYKSFLEHYFCSCTLLTFSLWRGINNSIHL